MSDLDPDALERTEANDALFRMLPPEQWARISALDDLEIGPDFLGFINVYAHLAKIIPRHFTVIDLGCAYAAQAFLFGKHRAYIGVDQENASRRFVTPNTTHYAMTIQEFIERHGTSFDREETFAICSYVPSWYGGSGDLVRGHFPNLFCFYPSHKAETRRIAMSMLPTREPVSDTTTVR